MRKQELINRLRDVAEALRDGKNPHEVAAFLDATAERVEHGELAEVADIANEQKKSEAQ